MSVNRFPNLLLYAPYSENSYWRGKFPEAPWYKREKVIFNIAKSSIYFGFSVVGLGCFNLSAVPLRAGYISCLIGLYFLSRTDCLPEAEAEIQIAKNNLRKISTDETLDVVNLNMQIELHGDKVASKMLQADFSVELALIAASNNVKPKKIIKKFPAEDKKAYFEFIFKCPNLSYLKSFIEISIPELKEWGTLIYKELQSEYSLTQQDTELDYCKRMVISRKVILELLKTNFCIDLALVGVLLGIDGKDLAAVFPFTQLSTYYQFMLRCDDATFKDCFLQNVNTAELLASLKVICKSYLTLDEIKAFNITYASWKSNFTKWKICNHQELIHQYLILRNDYYIKLLNNSSDPNITVKGLKFQLNELDELFLKQKPARQKSPKAVEDFLEHKRNGNTGYKEKNALLQKLLIQEKEVEDCIIKIEQCNQRLLKEADNEVAAV